jgi:hypothetical protein
MQDDYRFAASIGQNLDITPADSANAGTERLHGRLFAGETRCKFLDAPTVALAFPFGINALEKSFAMALEHTTHAFDFDDVDPDFDRPSGVSVPERDVISARH